MDSAQRVKRPREPDSDSLIREFAAFQTAMNRSVMVLVGLTLVLALAPAIQASAATSSGYVAYSVQVSSAGRSQSFSVNESVSASSHQGESILSLALKSASTNFTYSHLVNSSLSLFPYLPAVANDSFTYSNDSYSVTARVVQTGTSQVTFQGGTHTLNDFAISASFTSPQSSGTANGKLSAFQSDLVYSVAFSSNGTLVTATLTSTSLPLEAGSASPSIQAASAGVGVSVAAAAIALSLGVRARRKNGSEAAQKPDHWVD